MMKYPLLLLFASIFFIGSSYAQNDDDLWNKKMRAFEDTLIIYGDSLIGSPFIENRSTASLRIIVTLKRALKIKNSFDYSFISKGFLTV